MGDNVTIGHRAMVHGCRVMNAVRIGSAPSSWTAP
ncbi:MAG: hypothetical protein DMD87_17160 [Candidatus Rokuibacteriota bacterium]|nr:MAG: hypothetical protein DMD87_17160 [Candidatus Rokubacteria bacterium]